MTGSRSTRRWQNDPDQALPPIPSGRIKNVKLKKADILAMRKHAYISGVLERAVLTAVLGFVIYLLWARGLAVDTLGKIKFFLGLGFLSFAISGLLLGKVYCGSKYKVWRASRKKEPVQFWATTTFDLLVGLVLVIVGLKQ
jgi:hypothetical protein